MRLSDLLGEFAESMGWDQMVSPSPPRKVYCGKDFYEVGDVLVWYLPDPNSLVAGCAGYAGCAMFKIWIANNESVVLVEDLDSSCWGAEPPLHPKIVFQTSDPRFLDQLETEALHHFNFHRYQK